MKYIEKLNKQILNTQKMIDSTNELLIKNNSDTMLVFMLQQDEGLLKTLKQVRTKETLSFLKNNVSTSEQLLQKIYMVVPFEINPIDVAQKLGILVMKNSLLNDSEAGKCYINDEIVIEYKPQFTHNRERFSVAHELGHVVKHMAHANNTHYEDSTELLYARNDYIDSLNPIEKEADEFAGNILVPKQKILELLHSLEGSEQISTKLLCDIFKVSEGALYHTLSSYRMSQNLKIKKEYSWV
ncbi:MAG: ImmA/IrrE family metallo-endopeptidase [Sulfurovum sp.]|nr:ImmA/IrrE family metallo-endopeptidase [Sulfurovum sp.]